MEMPSTVHPKIFEINGYYFKIVSYAKLTDQQAARLARQFYHSRKMLKKDKGKTFTVITTFDENSANLI